MARPTAILIPAGVLEAEIRSIAPGNAAPNLARRAEVTVASITKMLLQDHDEARQLGQMSAAVSAVQTIAKLHGLVVDRSEVKSLAVDVQPAAL